MNAKNIIKQLELYKDLGYCSFDCPVVPVEICSWRGSYELPAVIVGPQSHNLNVKDFISFFEKLEGMEVCGHGGGEYILSEDDDIWLVGASNMSGHTGISHIECINDFEVIIHTKYQQY